MPVAIPLPVTRLEKVTGRMPSVAEKNVGEMIESCADGTPDGRGSVCWFQVEPAS